MMTKRLQTIALAALLLDEEERNEDTVLEHKNDHVGFAHGFNRGRKKAATTIFFKKLEFFNTV